MKDAEEKASAEAELRSKKETEVAELQDKVRLLESKCIQSIGKAREEGKQELRAKVANQLQGVFNRGFRDGWKSTLKKAGIPSSSDMFERSNTPLPYPKAGLKDLEDEEEDDEDEEEEARIEEAVPEQEARAEDSAHPAMDNPPTPTDGS